MLRLTRAMHLTRRIPLLLAFALLATTAHAQAVFRSVMPDGKIVYGSKPEPGAKEAKQVNLPPPNISTPAPAPAAAPAKAPAGGAEAPPPKETATADLAAARQKLEAAQKALEAGREPRDGERTGTARQGLSQLNEDYYKRIKALEDAVAAAQAEFDTAQRNAR